MPAKTSPSKKKPAAKKPAKKKPAAKKTAKKKPAAKKTATTAKKMPAAKKTATTAKKRPAAKKTATTAKKRPAAKKTATTAKKKPAAKKASTPPVPLAMKLGILEGMWIIDNAPPGFELLKPPKVDIGVDLNGPLRGHECVLSFVVDSEDVGFFADAWQAFKPAKGEVNLWLAYPKRGRGGFTTDLTGTRGWDRLTALGLEPVAQVVVDGVWSALRFRPVA